MLACHQSFRCLQSKCHRSRQWMLPLKRLEMGRAWANSSRISGLHYVWGQLFEIDIYEPFCATWDSLQHSGYQFRTALGRVLCQLIEHWTCTCLSTFLPCRPDLIGWLMPASMIFRSEFSLSATCPQPSLEPHVGFTQPNGNQNSSMIGPKPNHDRPFVVQLLFILRALQLLQQWKLVSMWRFENLLAINSWAVTCQIEVWSHQIQVLFSGNNAHRWLRWWPNCELDSADSGCEQILGSMYCQSCCCGSTAYQYTRCKRLFE